VLEIVDVEKRQREMTLSAVALQNTVDAMFDHAAGRQAGQFVIIGRAEQLILEGLLFGDVGGTRQQEIAVGNPHRPVRRQKYLFGLAAGNGLFQNRGAAGAEQFKAGLATIAGLRRRRCGGRHLQQRRGGIVRQQKFAALVLNRYAGREQPENVPQDVQFGIDGAFIFGRDRGRLKVMFIGTVHGDWSFAKPLLGLVKWNC
jgi:hypothetical protein